MAQLIYNVIPNFI